jgi:hypothetical protein
MRILCFFYDARHSLWSSIASPETRRGPLDEKE